VDASIRGLGNCCFVGDVDGDGINEIVAGSEDKTLRVLNGRDGELKWISRFRDRVRCCFVGDVDGDGINEIVAGSEDKTLRVFISPEFKGEEMIRAKSDALSGLSDIISSLLKEKEVVSVSDIPRGEYRGVPLISDEDILGCFEKLVSSGLEGFIDGDRLVSHSYIKRRISELSRVYKRVSFDTLAQRLNISSERIVPVIEDMILRGVLRARIDGGDLVFEEAIAPESRVPERLVSAPRDESYVAVQPPVIPGYRVVDVIGEGGFAIVYSAESEDGRRVALKLPKIFGYGTVDVQLANSFLKEAEVWSRLRFRNVVSVLDYGVTPIPFIVMEFMPGGSLRRRIGKLGWREAVEIFLQVASAIDYAQSFGVVHRDLKPENVLFTEDGVPKVSDWGLAKVMIDVSSRSGAGFRGTILYAAPEQVSPDSFGEVDLRTDVYQLGCLFYEMLTGSPPYPSTDIAQLINFILTKNPAPPSSVNKDVPKALDEVVLTALAKRKEERFKNADRMIMALENLNL